ncbi:hypothetical protein FrCorBMG51_16540 [Protofrankia coriariae]|uniref:EF-hand domain-containing protein n=1 Tax=Protofrankia coriariae TaxID=1562887 RepID=A0ABR5F1T0_9ACTN|nr:hypothetical protein FrCorBMG51_16540 [Protofrankia coriariae]
MKIQQVFLALDADRDGQVGWPDYQDLVRRHLEVFGVPAADPRGVALLDAYRSLWREFLRHGRPRTPDWLTMPEFVTANRSLSLDTSRLDMVAGVPGAIFDVIDGDRDDQITQADFDRFLRGVWRIAAPDAIEAFTGHDMDGDGRISRAEFLWGVREFFFSSDLSVTGSRYFGRL